MRTKRFHGLKRPKIRMSMNKYNFYNLAHLGRPETQGTYFQQKWKAKSAARAYHGEQIREKQWQRMFTSRIKSVIPMNFRYLAAFDGSEQAAGRGSGLDNINVSSLAKVDKFGKTKGTPAIPFMNMTFAPVERRLDTAIFRALFASSARQARQFVIHGGVKVNGKKMIYPGYLLNPGDMFQVDPERVLFALGAPKDTEDRQASRAYRKRLQKARAAAEVSAEAEVEASEEAAPAAAEEPVDEAAAEKKLRKQHKDTLQSLLQDAKSVLTNKSTDAPSAKKKQNIRAFAAAVRRAIGNANRTATEDLDSTVAELVAKLSLAHRKPASQPATPAAAVTDPSLQAQLTAQAHGTGPEALDPESKKTLAMALREIRENPIDASKAYATPWRPRPFLSAFAFIPRYLEVNHNICSAVYLRHPVARPGLSEVPTPFGAETGVLAYNWYLRRR